MKKILVITMLLSIAVFTQGQYKGIEYIESVSQNKQIQTEAFALGAKNAASTIDVHYLRMKWHIDPDTLYIQGSVMTAFHVLEGASYIDFQLSDELEVSAIVSQGESLFFQHGDDDVLRIFFEHPLVAGSSDSLEVFYQGIPPFGNGFGSFVKDEHNGVPIIWTLSEPYGAKDWWPGRNDISDKADSVDIYVTCPQQYSVASNGILRSVIERDEYREFWWEHKYPIASYLIAISVTNYVSYSDYVSLGTDSLEVLNYVFPESLEMAREQTRGIIPLIQLYDSLFGDYPFLDEKYGHAQFLKGGGMEHQTMSFMGGFGHELMAHELAHQWFGNKITLGSWSEIFLNEGFATYLAGLSYEHMFDGKYWPIWKENNIAYVCSQPDGSVYVQDTNSVARLFDARLSYSKGAMLLHMLRWKLGDEAFYEAIRNYLNEPSLAYGFARLSDLRYYLELASGDSLDEFFNDWFYGEGYPVYDISVQSVGPDRWEVTIDQESTHPSVDFFEMPLPLLFKGQTRDSLVVFNHNYSGEKFLFNCDFGVDSVIFDPEKWILSSDAQISLGLEKLKTNNTFDIYPNPSNVFLNIIFTQAGESYYRIYGLDSKMYLQGSFYKLTAEQSFRIDIRELPSGMYIIVAGKGGCLSSRKFIKG